MQQRQLRLGDILDDYCPRERRLTNHAVVAMVGPDVKQTRCTTCETEHEFKHAKVPRQRKKADTPAALYAQVLAGGPKKVLNEAGGSNPADPFPRPDQHGTDDASVPDLPPAPAVLIPAVLDDERLDDTDADADADADEPAEEGPVHRQLIRAQLPRIEGQPPPTRPAPDFTIRQPAGRTNRFRPRHQNGGGGQFHANRNGGNTAGGPTRSGSGSHRQGGGRPPMASRVANRQGRKRSK